jgi:aerobic-type carbon monoxide dehydrogenase small subunit (CoxS/CutS family)
LQDINRALDGNICRCCTYARIVVAVRKAAAGLKGGSR